MRQKEKRLKRNRYMDKRSILFQRCGGICPDCGKKMSLRNPKGINAYMTIDHIVPLSRGGTNNIDNLRGLCRSCNMNRGNCMRGVIYTVNEKGFYVANILRK